MPSSMSSQKVSRSLLGKCLERWSVSVASLVSHKLLSSSRQGSTSPRLSSESLSLTIASFSGSYAGFAKRMSTTSDGWTTFLGGLFHSMGMLVLDSSTGSSFKSFLANCSRAKSNAAIWLHAPHTCTLHCRHIRRCPPRCMLPRQNPLTASGRRKLACTQCHCRNTSTRHS